MCLTECSEVVTLMFYALLEANTFSHLLEEPLGLWILDAWAI